MEELDVRSVFVAFLTGLVFVAEDVIGIPDARKSFVTFEAVGVDEPWSVAGELRIP
jgi:hypothetical protein